VAGDLTVKQAGSLHQSKDLTEEKPCKLTKTLGRSLKKRNLKPRGRKRLRRPSLTFNPEQYNDEIPDPDQVIPE